MTLRTLNIPDFFVEPEELVGDPHYLAPLLRAIFQYTHPAYVWDPTGGSGVTKRVADEFGARVEVTDLNDLEHPVNLFSVRQQGYDLIVFHPDLWLSRPDSSDPRDLGGQRTWESYVDLCADAIEHLATLLAPNGRICVIAPIARRTGTVYYLAHELMDLLGAPSEPILIHPHPHCRSRGHMYGRRFIPIAHDEVLLYRGNDILEEPNEAPPEVIAQALR